MENIENLKDIEIQENTEQTKKEILFEYDSLQQQMYVEKGVEEAQQQNYKGALKYYEKALEESHNQNAYIIYNIGVVYTYLDNPKLAQQKFELALKIDPQFYQAYNEIADLYMQQDKYERAIQVLKKSIQIEQNYQAYYLLGCCMHEIYEYEKANEYLLLSIDLEDDHYQAYFKLGINYSSLTNFTAACDCFDMCICINPNEPNAYYNKGLALMAIKEYDMAIDEFNKTLKIDEQYIEAYKNMGICFLEIEKYDHAQWCFNKVYQEEDEQQRDSQNIFMMGYTLVQLDQLKDGLVFIQQAIDMDPGNQQYIEAQKYVEAAMDFERTL